MKGRVLAFDFGLNHIGVAVGSDELMTAQGLTALKANNGVPNEPALKALFAQWQPEYCVVGLPINMDGSAEFMTARATKFAQRLAQDFIVPVYLKDERLSSVEAKAEIFEHHGGYRTLVKHKGKVDATAAKIILESFFDEGGRYAPEHQLVEGK